MWVCGWQSITGTGFSPSSSVFPFNFTLAFHTHHLGDEQYAHLWLQFRDIVSLHWHEHEFDGAQSGFCVKSCWSFTIPRWTQERPNTVMSLTKIEVIANIHKHWLSIINKATEIIRHPQTGRHADQVTSGFISFLQSSFQTPESRPLARLHDTTLTNYSLSFSMRPCVFLYVTFILKMANVPFAKMLEGLQQSTQPKANRIHLHCSSSLRAFTMRTAVFCQFPQDTNRNLCDFPVFDYFYITIPNHASTSNVRVCYYC
jgi:hypothetical protein